MTSARRFGLVAAVLAAVATFGGSACHVLSSLGDCDRSATCPDTACALGHRCAASSDGDFCALDTGPLVIGALLPREGASASYGDADLDGFRFAAHLINDGEGNPEGSGKGPLLLGRRVAFKVMQDRPNEVTKASTQQLIGCDRVPVLLGGTNSNVALIAQSIAAPAKVLFLSPQATSPRLATSEPCHERYTFRTVSDAFHGEALAMAIHARQKLGCAKTYPISDGSEFAQGYLSAYRLAMDVQGGNVAVGRTIPTTVQDVYTAEDEAAAKAQPDCVLVLALPEVAGPLLEALRGKSSQVSQLAKAPVFLGGSYLHNQEFVATSAVAEGLYVSDADTTPDTKEYTAFRDRFNAYKGYDEGTDTTLVSSAFDAAVLAAVAIEKAGGVEDRVAIRDALWDVSSPEGHAVFGPDRVEALLTAVSRKRTVGCSDQPGGNPCKVYYKGASGPLRFDGRGSVRGPSAIYLAQGGSFGPGPIQRYPDTMYDDFKAQNPDFVSDQPTDDCP